jgi:hypothetical protein
MVDGCPPLVSAEVLVEVHQIRAIVNEPPHVPRPIDTHDIMFV